MPPKKLKIFPKTGKLQYINPSSAKLAPLVSSHEVGSSNPAADAARAQLELELCWCVQALEASIASGKLNAKQVKETERSISILKDNTQLVVRKRQTMSLACGDYRARMAAEAAKLRQNASSIQFTKRTFVGSYFFKKSALRSMGEPFKFEFPIADRMNQLDLSRCEDAVVTAADPASVNVSAVAADGVAETATTAPPSIALKQADNSFKFNFNVDMEDK